jgi:hypothetical protein
MQGGGSTILAKTYFLQIGDARTKTWVLYASLCDILCFESAPRKFSTRAMAVGHIVRWA